MNVEIFTLCDYSQVMGRKLVVVGPFDTVHAVRVPAVHSSCSLAMRIRFERSEDGDHPFRLNIYDLDGKPVVPELSGTMRVKAPQGHRTHALDISIGIPSLRFERYGEYCVRLTLDNQEKATLPLFVTERKTPPHVEGNITEDAEGPTPEDA